MEREAGFRRLVNFSDAVVAIAMTLLILPLVDSAGSIGTTGLHTFLHANQTKLLGFALSFVVIGSFWWGHHQTFERVRAYNAVLVWSMFVWLMSIVFLPFPTELISSATKGTVAVHGIYIGTMLVAAVAALVQAWAIVRWPELRDETHPGVPTIDASAILVVLMGLALVGTIVFPSLGLWTLVVLLLSRPLERAAARRRSARPVEA
jgi:uncharacterized membrane protein